MPMLLIVSASVESVVADPAGRNPPSSCDDHQLKGGIGDVRQLAKNMQALVAERRNHDHEWRIKMPMIHAQSPV